MKKLDSVITLLCFSILLFFTGCSTLATKPLVYDPEFFKTQIKDINILLVHTNFPEINDVSFHHFDSKENYVKLALHMKEDFIHNGLKTYAFADMNESSAVPSSRYSITQPEFKSVNTLLIYPEKMGVRGGMVINTTVHVALYSSGKIVWETTYAEGIETTYDFLSLDILTSLSKKNLFTPSHTPIESIDGKKIGAWNLRS